MRSESISMVLAAVRDNVAALAQAVELLASLDAPGYARAEPACFNSSAGGHLRHVLEHYTSFLQGLGTGLIDYEARARDPRIERDPEHAARCVEEIRTRLASAAAATGNTRLRVRSETARAGEPEPWGDSCALRELEFLLSHTVHHFALIGVICALGGHALPENFGVAPSTLRYRERQKLAAVAAA